MNPTVSARSSFPMPLGGCSLLALTSLLATTAVLGQSPESEYIPAQGQFEPGTVPEPDAPFVAPDIPDSILKEASVDSKWFTLKPGLVILADYTAFAQDTTSVAQVGRQNNQTEFRGFRAMFRGTLGREYKISYLVAAEYNGFDTNPKNLWELTDLSFTFPLFGPATKLVVGKTKETFDYEMVGDAANLPHQERVLSPFFLSRNIGVKVVQVIGDDHRMTASAGVFNDWWVTGDSLDRSGTDASARVTGLLWDQPDGKNFLHLGISGRYAGADNNTARYRARPESNVSEYYLDTGSFTSDHAWNVGLEALWNQGPFSILSEYNHAWVEAPTSGSPEFYGYYFTGSWILTGETRPYDRTVGYARRVMPTHRWGAPELVFRFAHEDLNGGLISGGSFDKTYVGINWWATRRWKAGMGWSHTWLDRFGTQGITDSFLARLQWIY